MKTSSGLCIAVEIKPRKKIASIKDWRLNDSQPASQLNSEHRDNLNLIVFGIAYQIGLPNYQLEMYSELHHLLACGNKK